MELERTKIRIKCLCPCTCVSHTMTLLCNLMLCTRTHKTRTNPAVSTYYRWFELIALESIVELSKRSVDLSVSLHIR